MKKIATIIISFMLAGMAALFANIEEPGAARILYVVFIVAFTIGGALMGLISVFGKRQLLIRLLGMVAVGLNVWVLLSLQ